MQRDGTLMLACGGCANLPAKDCRKAQARRIAASAI
jgi:hypothetical protein